MKNKLNFFLLLIALCFQTSNSLAGSTLSLKKFEQKPKLIVLLVFDQFRADYLTRFGNQFLPATQSDGKPGGFRYLMQNGAYFPFAEYDVLQAMTCPGHAMIATGAHPYLMGIPLNDFYDRNQKRMAYCVDDAKDQFSPRSLQSSTFSDEIKSVHPSSKVIAVALKDRSSIMLGGHRANFALWMDLEKYHWKTSSYYANTLPQWVISANQSLAKDAQVEQTWMGQKYKPLSKMGISFPFGVDASFDLAEKAIAAEKLGKGSSPDVLAISLSSHDMLGHRYGPESKEMQEMTLFEDQRLSEFFYFLKQHLGSLDQVTIALTADHGVAPTVEHSQASRIPTDKFDYLELYKKVNAQLDKKFGSAKKPWIVGSDSFNFYFDQDLMNEKKLASSDVEAEAKSALVNLPGVLTIVTRSEILKGLYPAGEIGQQLKRQYVPEKSGDLILITKPFYIEKGSSPAVHVSGYAYDRMVPLILFGSKFKPGVYASEAKVIDLAPTLAFSVGVLPPAASEGKILPIF